MALQTRHTCWFYSILNGFMLSDGGKKILYNKMTEFYSGLNSNNQAYFNSNLNAPCPASANKINKLYFWKFIKQFLCEIGRPKGKSPLLLRNVPGNNNGSVRTNKGQVPSKYIGRILKHLGFTDQEFYEDTNIDHRRRPQFVVIHNTGVSSINLNKGEYSLICANIVVKVPGYAHAVAGYIKDGKGYIFDSASNIIIKCKWWVQRDMSLAMMKIVNHHTALKTSSGLVSFNYPFFVYARKEFINGVAMTCKLPSRNNGGGANTQVKNRNVKVLTSNNKKLLRNVVREAERVPIAKRKFKNILSNTPVIRFKTKENIKPSVNTMFSNAGWHFTHRNYNRPGLPSGRNLKPNYNYYLLRNSYNPKLIMYKNKSINNMWKFFPLDVMYYSSSVGGALANKNVLNEYLRNKNF